MKPAMTELLLGDEAVALGAIHEGIGGAFSYPGTPATEIFEFVRAYADGRRVPTYVGITPGGPLISARWSANEKVAYEEALGMSFAGCRALVSMKHVGLNVAADPFINSALTGARGGLVLAVADDPGMHSSQNEQDSRLYADFAQIPCFEPADQQEAYDMTRAAFELSERVGLPVMVRLVTRLAHSRAPVLTREGVNPKPIDGPPDWREWTLLPPNARRRFRRLIELQATLRDHAEGSPFNPLQLRGPRGIIACGIARNYVRVALGNASNDSLLKIGVYPPPAGLIRQLVDHCDELLVVEEGYPFVERQLRGLLGLPGKSVRGKLDGRVPIDGELTTDLVAEALELKRTPTFAAAPTGRRPAPEGLPARPPRLCDGCPHCDTFRALVEAVVPWKSALLLSDIGCYTLGAYPPFNAVSSCVDMGASISMAHGAAKAGAWPVVCTIGDSTFVHSGMTGLIGAAADDADMTVIVLDNATVAMTGNQEVFVTGDRLVELIRSLGVNSHHLHSIKPFPRHHDQNVALLRREIEHHGLSVVVACLPCIHLKRRAAASARCGGVEAPAGAGG